MELFRRSSSQPHPADWSQAPKATKLLALAVVLLVVAGIVAIQQAGRAYETQGPSRIARNAADSVLIGAYEKLFLVDAQQHLIKLTAADLGLGGPINSITADGSDWLLGDDASGLFYRCTASLGSCQPMLKQRSERMFSRAHGVALLSDRMIISDSERHRLRVYDRSGNEMVATRTQPVALCYPNDVIVVEGMWYVTDTNNFRIARIDPVTFNSETFIQTAGGAPLAHANCADLSSHVAERGDAYGNLILDTVNTVGRPTLSVARKSRILPASLLHTRDNAWWVVQMKNMMTLGDVIVYSSDGTPQLRIKLPEDSEPTNMLETADGVLITDPTLARIYDVSLDGSVREDWGPQALKEQWQQILVTRSRWELLEPLGWGLIGLSIVLGIVVIVREVLRTKGNWNPKAVKLEPVSTKPQPLRASEMWIAVEPAFHKRSRVTAWIFAALVLALLVFIGHSFYSFLPDAGKMSGAITRITWMLSAILAALLGLVAYSLRLSFLQLNTRLGTNGRELLFDPGTGKILACNFEQVLVGQQMLLTDKRFISIYTKQGKPIYPIEQLQPLILARIPRANFVTPAKIFLASLKRGNVSTWSGIVTILLVVVTKLGPLLFPELAQHLNHLMVSWLKH